MHEEARGREHRPELDGLRALAALSVVAFHGFAPAAAHHGQTPFQAIGARGVDVFFVLSGFCLSWPYTRERMTTVGHMLTFLRRRVTRIAPTFYAALALFAILSLTRFGLPAYAMPASAHARIAELVRDAAFLPTLTPIHDPVMWTLGVEMRWYVVFPVVLIVFYRSKIAFALLAVAAYVCNQTIALPDAGVLPAFMLGIVAAHVVKKNWRYNAIVWTPVAACALVWGVQRQAHRLSIDHTDIVWQIACFASILAVTTQPQLRRIFSWRPFVAIGVASYSIYLIHEPFLNSLVWAGVPALPAALAGIALGYVFWYGVERPLCSKRSRAAMESWLLRLRPNRTAPVSYAVRNP